MAAVAHLQIVVDKMVAALEAKGSGQEPAKLLMAALDILVTDYLEEEDSDTRAEVLLWVEEQVSWDQRMQEWCFGNNDEEENDEDAGGDYDGFDVVS